MLNLAFLVFDFCKKKGFKGSISNVLMNTLQYI